MEEVTRLFDIPRNQLSLYNKEIMFCTKIHGKWNAVSTSYFLEKVDALSKGLIALGILPGDKIALVSSNRIEWNMMDIAIQQVGAICVPIYPNISIKDYTFIFNDAGIKMCFTSTDELYKKIDSIKAKVSTLDKTYCFDKVANVDFYEDLIEAGKELDFNEVESRMELIKKDDLVTIIYTSGTTGNPKGVMLSHSNLLSNIRGCRERIPANENSRCLSFLPVCHVYERMLHYLYMYCGCSIYFAESMETIGDNIREVKPHVFTAVPRLLEKVYEKIMTKGDELRGIKRKLFFWAVSLGEEYEVVGKSTWYCFKLKIARKLIFSKWKEALGGEVNAIASGSAALSPKLSRIFLAAGVPILEGYGLTETSPVISVNCFDNGIKIGTVGTTIKDVTVKIADDGEILVKGPNIMMGYYNNQTKTAEEIDTDGWFHTGDIGQIEEGKFLRITDRKKEIFKTSGGKYIIPQMMENKFNESRFIKQIIVIGEGQKHPSALIVPQYNFIRNWAKKKGVSLETCNDSLCKNKKVVARIQREVDRYNENYGNFEKIKKFALLSKELSIEGGELTPTLKLKRKVILELHKDKVIKIYGETI